MFYNKILNDFLFFFFALFVIASAFSIALAQSALGVSLLIFIILIIYKKINPFTKELKWFYLSVALYVLWMLLSAVMNPTPLKSLLIIKEEWLFCVVPIGVYILRREPFRKKIILGLGIAIGLVSIYGLIQHISGIHWFKEKPLYDAAFFGYYIKGFFSHRLTFGNYMVTAFSFIFGYYLFNWKNLIKYEKIFWGTVSLLSFSATLLTYSYGPILALFITILMITILMGKKKIILFVSLPALLVLLIAIFSLGLDEKISAKISKEMNIENQASRVYIWDKAFQMIEEKPLFGVGQGNFYDVFEKNNPGKRIHVHAHNDLINIAGISGIPGMIFYGFIWVSLFGYCISKYRSKDISHEEKLFFFASLAGSTAFFISSLTEATFADEEVRQFLMFIWAAGLFGLADKRKIQEQ